MVALMCILAILLGPLFSEVISLVGAFSMSLVAFILPAAFYLKLFPAREADGNTVSGRAFQRAAAWAILFVGLAAMVVATGEAVSNMVYFFSHDGHERQCGGGASGGGGSGGKNHTNSTHLS